MAAHVFHVDEVTHAITPINVTVLMNMIQKEVVQPLLSKIKELHDKIDEASGMFQATAASQTVSHEEVAPHHDANIVLSAVTMPTGETFELVVNQGTFDACTRATSARAAIREILLFWYGNDIKSLALLYRSFKNKENERYEGAKLFPECLESAIVAYIRDTWYPTVLKSKEPWNSALNTKTVDTLGIILTAFRKVAKETGLIKEIENPSRSNNKNKRPSNDSEVEVKPKKMSMDSTSSRKF